MASESHYGLSLVLGGGEVTAQELAKLYALLANRGELRPLRMQLNETESTPVRLLSEEASFITLDMLRQHRRPGDTLAQRSSSLPVYWKTGTSWLSRRLERRDFRPLRAGGVGRQLRRARQQCVGRRRGGRAAVLQYHRQRQRQLPRPAGTEAPVPQRLRRVDICLASGDLPTPWCQQKGKTWFIPGKSPIKVDSVYRPVVLDIHSGEVVCPPYDAAQTRTEILSSGLPIWPTYSPRPGCRSGAAGQPLQGQRCRRRRQRAAHHFAAEKYHLYPAPVAAGRDKIAFNAVTDADSKTVYWFVDDIYLGSSASKSRSTGGRSTTGATAFGQWTIAAAPIRVW